jgi:hypothetical protein
MLLEFEITPPEWAPSCNHHGRRGQSWILEAGAYHFDIPWRIICDIHNSSYDPGVSAPVRLIQLISPALVIMSRLYYSALYMHALKFPWNAKFDTPELYGLARMLCHTLHLCLSLTTNPAGKTLSLNLTTSDGVRLGAWFVAADGFYQKHLRLAPPSKGESANLGEKR